MAKGNTHSPSHEDIRAKGDMDFDMMSFLAKHNDASCSQFPSAKKAAQICSGADNFPDIFVRVDYLADKCISLLKNLSETVESESNSEFSRSQFRYNFDIYIEVSSCLCSMIIETTTEEIEKPDDFPDVVSDSALILDLPDRFKCTAILMRYMIKCARNKDFNHLSYSASALFAMDLKTMLTLNSDD